jgi:hypothetical protein
MEKNTKIDIRSSSSYRLEGEADFGDGLRRNNGEQTAEVVSSRPFNVYGGWGGALRLWSGVNFAGVTAFGPFTFCSR